MEHSVDNNGFVACEKSSSFFSDVIGCEVEKCNELCAKDNKMRKFASNKLFNSLSSIDENYDLTTVNFNVSIRLHHCLQLESK